MFKVVCFFSPIIQIEDFKNEHCGKLQPNQINTISILLVDHNFFSQISSIEISRSSIMIERMVWAWTHGNYVSTTCWIFSNSKKKLKKNKNWKKKFSAASGTLAGIFPIFATNWRFFPFSRLRVTSLDIILHYSTITC